MQTPFVSSKVEKRPVASLIPYVRNARTHDEDQIAQIAASIAEFGFTSPLLIGPDDVVIAGHGRLLAAQELGLEEVPVIVLGHLTEAQRRALVIADNRIAENAGWDREMLAAELAALQDETFDLDLLGFGESEIDELLEGIGDLGEVAGDADAPGFGSGAGGEAEEGKGATGQSGSLAERFGVAPFSVLDARKGWWQHRKAAWIALGIRSELGRGEGDRACPGGSPMPGQGSRKDYEPGQRKAAADG